MAGIGENQIFLEDRVGSKAALPYALQPSTFGGCHPIRIRAADYMVR